MPNIFFKKYLCKHGCGDCPLNYLTEQFPHTCCKFYEFIDDLVDLEDHIEKHLDKKEK